LVAPDPPNPPEPIPPESVAAALLDSEPELEPPDPPTVLDSASLVSAPLVSRLPVPASPKRSVDPASNAGPLHPRANSVKARRFTCHLASTRSETNMSDRQTSLRASGRDCCRANQPRRRDIACLAG